MKKLLIFITVLTLGAMANAQEAAELKNAGNAALKTKDYETALAKYEAYLASGEEGVAGDKATIYNAATCAYKLKKYDISNKYFAKSVEMKYKADLASYYIANSYKASDPDTYIAKIDEAYKTYTTSKYKKNFLKILTNHYNKIASVPYNAGNTAYNSGAASGDVNTYKIKVKEAKVKYAEAKKAFEKTLEYDPGNAMATSALKNMESNIKAYNDYIKSIQ